MHETKIPLSVIGGFLGAGKTTLLNRILSQSSSIRYGVLVNDFGSIAVDEHLVTRHQGDTISFANGCVCCSLGNNLVQSIDRLIASEYPPEQFLVEASGVASPRAIADVATLHPELTRDLTVVMVDAQTVFDRLKDPRLSDTMELQLQSADLIVVNKCDLVSESECVRQTLSSSWNVPMIDATHADIPLSILDASESRTSVDADTSPSMLRIPHAPQYVFDSATFAMNRLIAEDDLRKLLRAPGILRAKGFVRICEHPGLSHVETVADRTTFQQRYSAIVEDVEPVLVVIGLVDHFDKATFSSKLNAALEKA